ncbi:protein-disulfide reductase DsbD family protein [Methylobacterium nigriterrae]|uniref:protein-disulfide reductase DsbD family protein n=1 Tax=Methylobacterium nigriterrae TaxID=3127512 RepID=UPI003013E120
MLLLLVATAAVAADGLDIGEVREGSVDGRPALAVELSSSQPLGDAALSITSSLPLVLGPARVTLDSSKRGALVLLPLAEPLVGGGSLGGREFSLTVSDGTRSTTAQVRVRERHDETSLTPWEKAVAGLGMLGLAFLGGLILNLMPCVLPVLTLKLLAAVRLGGGTPAQVRAGFLATAAGVVASFLVLALGLILVRRAGGIVGWGIQFQEPGFVAGLAVVTALFAANLWGLFDLALPRAFASRIGGPAREGLAGQFAVGFFATLLATPCSAPFVGTAIGFALPRSGMVILAVFLALGLGLAAPYLAIAAVPRLASWLPRPGPWMLHLRRGLSLALAGTALWLLSILSAQVGPLVATSAGVLLAVMTLLFAPRSWTGGRVRRAISSGIGALAVSVLVLPVLAEGRLVSRPATPETGTVAWRPFDRGILRALVAEGHTVLVDVDARWCPTCRLNEHLVFDRALVADRLADDVLPMKADWTLADPAVSAFLASYGRYGVPFTIVYGPGAPSGLPLREILTTSMVFDAMALAKKADGMASTPTDRQPLARR